MQLPADLRAAIEALLDGEARRDIAQAATAVSLKYRRETSAPSLQIASGSEARAYAASRLPATWCAVSDVLYRLLERNADFHPSSLLDLGAGPGTATLAARSMWPDINATLVEPNPHLRAVGENLVPGDDWCNETLERLSLDRSFDLTIASYVFNEISAGIESLFEKIWAKTSGALVLIEPGTPQGYQMILKARKFFLGIGAHIAAPCPHHLACPLEHSDRWCHFSVRVERSRLHLQIKADAQLSYEDEKFSYLVVTRSPLPLPHARALGHPHGAKVISLETCSDDGEFRILQASKRDEIFKTLKKADWGDAID